VVLGFLRCSSLTGSLACSIFFIINLHQEFHSIGVCFQKRSKIKKKEMQINLETERNLALLSSLCNSAFTLPVRKRRIMGYLLPHSPNGNKCCGHRSASFGMPDPESQQIEKLDPYPHQSQKPEPRTGSASNRKTRI
jgi:hypothetical protein